MSLAAAPQPFHQGYQLIDGSLLNTLFAFPVVSSQDGITAHAGGGQSNATQITASFNRVSTVATAGDSVKLPKSEAGMKITIFNEGANAMQVFSHSEATINGIAAGTGISQPAASGVDYYCIKQGQWLTDGGINTGAFTGTFDGVLGGTIPAAATVTTLTVNSTSALHDTITITDAKNIVVGSTTGTKIGTASTQKLGFFNTTPVVQPSTTGTSTGFTAGGGTTATSTSTFTGNTGSTAYTVGDIVLALKQVGLLAA